MLLSLTDTVNMKLVEVFEAFVMYGHILHLETYLYKFLHGSPPCIVIVKEGTNGGYLPVIEIANAPCHITHGVHHKAMADDFFFH